MVFRPAGKQGANKLLFLSIKTSIFTPTSPLYFLSFRNPLFKIMVVIAAYDYSRRNVRNPFTW